MLMKPTNEKLKETKGRVKITQEGQKRPKVLETWQIPQELRWGRIQYRALKSRQEYSCSTYA